MPHAGLLTVINVNQDLYPAQPHKAPEQHQKKSTKNMSSMSQICHNMQRSFKMLNKYQKSEKHCCYS